VTINDALARIAIARVEVDSVLRWMHDQQWPIGHPERPTYRSRLAEPPRDPLAAMKNQQTSGAPSQG